MPLTHFDIRNTKPADKPFKLSDGGGLFLLVQPNGSMLWRLKYRFVGKERALSFGAYPTVSLADARAKRDEAKKLLDKEKTHPPKSGSNGSLANQPPAAPSA
jgi:Arm domain-containing DNA-binding protein